MRLLRFDRAGHVVSEKVDITSETEKFLRCLLSVFSNKPSELGYCGGVDVTTTRSRPRLS